ncbi:hypothetical protein M8756_03325 [Lutimaribacter sp. EGI FJ00015]|nr:hypothetical protein [Lutimaribacter sp. EGI FJ00015]
MAKAKAAPRSQGAAARGRAAFAPRKTGAQRGLPRTRPVHIKLNMLPG